MSQSDLEPQPGTAVPFCPWEHFDADWYVASHMRRLPPGEPSDPLAHYTAFGGKRGYSPNPYFDEPWYMSAYPDVRNLVTQGQFASGFDHYCATGHATRDPHWLFNEGIYRARRGDLSPHELAGNGLRNGYHHFLIAGQNEGVSGSAFFDPACLKDATGIAELPFTALLTAPWLGSLPLSRYFDPDWYLAMHEQVEDLIADGIYTCALHHYLANPTPALFAGSADFDEAFYRTRYQDIAEAADAGFIRNGYLHFIDHGRFENRQPSPWFDPQIYQRQKGVAAALRADPSLTAFDHYLRVGRKLGLPATSPPYAAPPAERPGTEAAGKDIFVRMARLWANGGNRMQVRFPAVAAPDISVVMCAFNHHDLTIQTLLHLSGSTGASFEVILIDNASIDATRHIEQRVDGLRLIRNATNVGFLRATNQGIEAARGRHILLLNNDIILPPNALHLAMQRLEQDETIGAVGGKVVRTHGQLQEAGCILFSNGSALGYGRDADPFEPDYNFVRDVDYCSGVFLMLRASVMHALGGLDLDYAPAYYEETDLCVRIWKAGLRVVYDPSVVIIHLEFGSSRNPDAPRALMRRNRDVFLSKHRDWLSTKTLPDLRTAINGRTATHRPRVLLIEDTIPYRHIGSGFVRTADVVASLVDLGCEVTVLPMNPMDLPADPRAGFDETVELLWNHDISTTAAFFRERESYYDYIWVCRAHNLHRLASVIDDGAWGPMRNARVVLDTEALACNRDAASAALEGRSFDINRALKRELRQAYLVQDICCVNAVEQAQLIGAGLPRVHVLGHAIDARPTPAPFSRRRDILALGSLYGAETPNFDGLCWFLAEVWPRVRQEIGDARLLIAGFVAEGLDVRRLLSGTGVVHMGFVDDPRTLYETARVFVAPTRFAAGIPFKVHEAASFGVPVMATTLLCDQLGWQSERDILARSPDDAASFAADLIRLYSDAALWQTLRENALERIGDDCGRADFTAVIKAILHLGG